MIILLIKYDFYLIIKMFIYIINILIEFSILLVFLIMTNYIRDIDFIPILSYKLY